ncbi:hypothetical protein [Streptomyces sp. NPDC093097]|uniref:hypothetical protein n=1 Tax=Streptomyces sp. NPDC093097 TaxID=3366027 RepID=UPI00381C2640
MAARKTTDDRPQATVQTQQYAAGTGWEVGQAAPSDAFRALDDQAAPYGPVVHTHPGGHARLIVAKGATVTESAARELAAESAED